MSKTDPTSEVVGPEILSQRMGRGSPSPSSIELSTSAQLAPPKDRGGSKSGLLYFFHQFLRREYLSIISLIVFLLAWEGVCYFKIIGPYQLVPPTTVLKVFILKLTQVNPDGAYLWAHALSSLGLALLGFLGAALIGVPLGLFMGWYTRLNLVVRPIFDLIRPIPPIAWIPLAILWLGIGVKAKAYIIFLASFVPCVINSFTGIRLTNPILARVARVHGASDFTVFLKIGLPSAIPMIFNGLRLSLNAAWTTLVAAELVAASQGLGFMIQMGRRLARPDIVIVGMLTIGVLGALLSWGLSKAESHFVSSRRLT
ncbi:MAG: ABC transporter permease [Deltaproteobacteria bacterium]|jgi:NitT/TauT family transport system permease protein|nr:ABC transporter permease [Deltaproteobacteria bacterium]